MPSQAVRSAGTTHISSVSLAPLAFSAIAFPTLIAFNVAPSATFLNQAAAFVGWGCFLLLLDGLATSALLAEIARRAGACSGRWPLSSFRLWPLPSLPACPGLCRSRRRERSLSAILVIAVGNTAARAGVASRAFQAFCIGLVLAGAASSIVGLVQVFAPTLPDGDWIAISAIPGRATGNLRQPNHLSSLLLWSIVAAIWLGESRVLRRPSADRAGGGVHLRCRS